MCGACHRERQEKIRNKTTTTLSNVRVEFRQIRSESCYTRSHFFRAVQTLSVHLSTSVVGVVAEHARENDSVWRPRARAQAFAYVPFNLNRPSSFSCKCHFSRLLLLPFLFFFGALVGSNEPGLVRKTESEKTNFCSKHAHNRLLE